MIIDTHAHLCSDEVYPIVDQVIDRALAMGVEKMVNICTDAKSLERGFALRDRYPFIYNTAATTPHDVEKDGSHFLPIVESAAKKGQLIAIGETGLDYYYEHSSRNIQKEYLLKYFALATSYQLPLIFHCRDAFDDLFAFADVDYVGKKAAVHCFTGSIDEARKALDRGWYISFSGVVTFKKSQQLRDVAHFVPLDKIFIETDSPYLAPQTRRGKQNEPSFIIETAQVIAGVKGVDVEEVMQQTSKNACAFFSF